MFHTDKVYIWPPDGIAEGETEKREIPLAGYFAVKFGKGRLEQALLVRKLWNRLEFSHWEVYLDGFIVAPPSGDWKTAFGHLWKTAQSRSHTFSLLLGRPIAYEEYAALAAARHADKQREIDLSAAVDLNSVEPAF